MGEKKGSGALYSTQPGEGSQASENLERDNIEFYHQTTKSSKNIPNTTQKSIATMP